MRNTMDLHGSVALVTGGAHRVGRAIVLALAEAGASIALHYHRSDNAARATLADLQSRQVAAVALRGDLALVAEGERVIDETLARFGRLNVLVCCAGAWERTPPEEVTEEQWDTLFALNARAPFFMARHAAPHLRAAGGCIITISDVMTHTSWKNHTPYLASKAALEMVTRNLAREFAPEVRVNAVAPGPVLLPETWNETQRNRAARSTVLGRVGRAEDVAAAVVYLACADYVTGVVLPVDGGHHLT